MPREAAAKADAKPPKPCPICSRPAAPDTYPFCSKRCREVDLARWLSGTYVIPSREGEEDEGE